MSYQEQRGAMDRHAGRLTGEELLHGVDVLPRHELWARITPHNTLVGVAIFLVLGTLFVIAIDLHLSRNALAPLGVLLPR